MHSKALAFVAFLALTCGATPADAQDAAASTQGVHRAFGARLEALGGMTFGEMSGFAYGAGLYLRYWIFQVGWVHTVASSAIINFGGDTQGLVSSGAVAGVRLETNPQGSRRRLDLLLSAGYHGYSNIGAQATGGVLGSRTIYAVGMSDSMPYLGLRVGGAWEWGGNVRFTLGGAGFVEADLTRIDKTQTVYPGGYSSGGWSPMPPPMAETRRLTLGGVQMGVMLALGISLDS